MRDKRLYLIILILASVAIHFAFFGRPNETVFDEVHFGKFVSAYSTHQYYFDIHPPLGKLMIAGFGNLFGFRAGFSFAEIGQPFPDKTYLALRFLPELAGTLLPIVIFLLALELGLSATGAFGAGALVMLDNALLTQSRYILLDPFLLLFGFAAVLFYFKYRNSRRLRDLAWMAAFAGLSVSIKWTGLGFLGLVGLIELIDIVRQRNWTNIGKLILFWLGIPLAIYFSVFAVHFSLLTRSGDGDAFMSPQFRKTLAGTHDSARPDIKPLNTVQKFIELNKEMYQANKTLTATHPYSSKWYTWPFMARPIYYWLKPSTVTPSEEKIYLIGNPIIWWASTVAVLYLLLSSIGKDFFKKKLPLILLGAYFINYLPFIGIGRVMFLYHYLAALIFAILILAYLIDRQNSRKTWIAVLSIAAILFVFFAPLSYGLPLEAGAFNSRMWLSSWR